MAKTNRIIDYLDVALPIAEPRIPLFKQWLKDFIEEQDTVEGRPKIRRGELQINSTDLIAFLGFIDRAALSEIELKRLTTNARKEYERLLFNSIALDHRYHYKWCLAALKNLPIGRRRPRRAVAIPLRGRSMPVDLDAERKKKRGIKKTKKSPKKKE